jgi:hypothetical protein
LEEALPIKDQFVLFKKLTEAHANAEIMVRSCATAMENAREKWMICTTQATDLASNIQRWCVTAPGGVSEALMSVVAVNHVADHDEEIHSEDHHIDDVSDMRRGQQDRWITESVNAVQLLPTNAQLDPQQVVGDVIEYFRIDEDTAHASLLWVKQLSRTVQAVLLLGDTLNQVVRGEEESISEVERGELLTDLLSKRQRVVKLLNDVPNDFLSLKIN